MEDRCATGRKLKLLTVVDEFTRECLAITVARSIRAHDVIRVLDTLFHTRTTCAFIRSDNGPEFIARTLNQWLSENGARTIYIDPASPWQNAYGESFNGRFRDECLNMEVFNTMAEAQIVTEMWRRQYNEQRPHSSLGYLTPAEFVAGYNTANSPDYGSTSLSLSGLPNGQEQQGQDMTPCPFVQPPTAALESLSSGALSSGWARKTIP
jgi:transposase InsO family protein